MENKQTCAQGRPSMGRGDTPQLPGTNDGLGGAGSSQQGLQAGRREVEQGGAGEKPSICKPGLHTWLPLPPVRWG